MLAQIVSRTKKTEIGLTQEKHLLIKIHENAELNTDDCREVMALKHSLVENNPRTVLYIAPELVSVTLEARKYMASPEVYKNVIAKAIVVKSFPSRLLARSFITMDMPAGPTRLFRDEMEACAWLTKMRNEHSRIRRFKI